VNSLFAMELVLFIEDSCGFTIPNDDLTLDNFRSVRAMAALVARLTASSGVPVGRSEP
jgi:methoxymalonate biosynthesis acyl carrier protein